eukprot:NODE_360_length_8799_cov_0.293448.p2 type:complete len:721 gc:universal NODE_360_length_8799_cov_0.293448:5601-3439(-)
MTEKYPRNCLNSNIENDVIPFTLDEIKAALGKMPMNKSTGSDKLPIELVKYADPLLLEMLTDLFVSIQKCLLIPDLFITTILHPIPKGVETIDIHKYRYLGMTSHLKKMMEKMLQNRYSNELRTSDVQYGYKKGVNHCDAVYDLDSFLKQLPKAERSKYKIKKYDQRAAFDTCSRVAICNMLDDLIPNKVDCYVLKYLVVKQRVMFRIGPCYSSTRETNTGVIQGSVLSPLLFALLMDRLLGDLRTRENFFSMFSDDLVAAAPETNFAEFDLELTNRLESVNLYLNDSKTRYLTAKDSYLGILFNQNGFSRKQQVDLNLKAANTRKYFNIQTGVFNGALNARGLLTIYKSMVLPLIEKGLKLFPPEKTIANRINSFILKDVRDYIGASSSMTNDYIYQLYNMEHFYFRWHDLHARHRNHTIQRLNQPISQIVTFPKVKYSMSSSNIHKRTCKYKRLQKLLKLQIPPQNLDYCHLCNKSHKSGNIYKNQYWIQQCGLKFLAESSFVDRSNITPINSFTQIGLDMAILPYNMNNDRFICDYNNNLYEIMYTDASFTLDKSTGCIFKPATKSYILYDFTTLNINSSTRSEIACIVEATKCRDDSKHLLILTDSMSAIQAIQLYQSNGDYGKINNLDLIIQGNFENVEMKHVYAHKEENDEDYCRGNDICDVGCNLPLQDNSNRYFTSLVSKKYPRKKEKERERKNLLGDLENRAPSHKHPAVH